MSPKPVVECWFEFASTYSYVGVIRAPDAFRGAGLKVVWKPFLLGPLFTAQLGIRDSPFNHNPIRGRYMWRDLERLCEKYRLPFRLPTVFPRNSLLASRVAIVASDEPWGEDFIRGVFRANFADDQEISDPKIIASVLDSCGVTAEPILARAASDAVKARLRAQTDAAAELGIFGAPNFLVGGELFFGQDRLEDAIAWAQR